jgi:hypothetical protein
MVIKSGTSIAATGGSDVTFAPDGQTIQNGVHLIVPAISDFRVRPQLTVKYRPPVLNPQGVYNKDKKTLSYTIPKLLDDGTIVFNVVRVEREVHPESTPEEAAALLEAASQFCFDTDVSAFWATGSLT